MIESVPKTKYLKDYTSTDFFIDRVNLSFKLDDNATEVTSTLQIKRNLKKSQSAPIVLDGAKVKLLSLSINGDFLATSEYSLTNEALTIFNVPTEFTLDIKTLINPKDNTNLEGLYKSGSMFCTQCEAEGFRKITYFIDRPDIMAKYTCTIIADKSKYPVLLSNGNLIKQGILDENFHFATWNDPFKKPSYLFALVAGDLVCIEDSFVTKSGRTVALRIYVEPENADFCGHAMNSLKKSMKWDEEKYNREYDLDIYMIVAANDFNFGAMENKGLNIFNSRYVLAKPETATDDDFLSIESVIAHEYFHNWTGNRITLKNWFQLSLKEGLTVFRDQEFSSDMWSRAVTRINEVRGLRKSQFPEDAGPMAHSVIPQSYIQMNNFYTNTVYIKGAEVIRMMNVILGDEGFKKGMDLYFETFDGCAVTIEDFIKVMERASNINLEQFKIWYYQAGTPQINVKRKYDIGTKKFYLTFSQTCPKTPGQDIKLPMHIPVAIGLINKQDGMEMPIQFLGETSANGFTRVINLKKESETFVFENVLSEPIPSVLREFSAPVKLKECYSEEDLIFLLANDKDFFNKWDASQRIIFNSIKNGVDCIKDYQPLSIEQSLIEAFRKILVSPSIDKLLLVQIFSLPLENELANLFDEIDPDRIHEARNFLVKEFAVKLYDEFVAIYEQNKDEGEYTIDTPSITKRKLKNLSLFYLSKIESKESIDLIFECFKKASNMTDEISALRILSNMDVEEKAIALDMFYKKWNHIPLILDKWFAVQALSDLPSSLTNVYSLLKHNDFSYKIPNKVRALIGSFCSENVWNFHRLDGEGYKFLRDQVLILDKINPQITARLVTPFNAWKKYDKNRQIMMKDNLEIIYNTNGLSKDVYEIVSKALV
ncbi:MAG: aminopeptidase N [Desulfobacterales bacterium]|nr:aminopeptidase N [Desulfobacterales bacterium]